jgi:hypothetical protein
MYINIFADIKPRSNFNTYENQFTSMTNQNYRDFLYQSYIIENKSKSYIANLLGVFETTIHSHLKRYDIKKEYKQDTSKVMNKTPSMIEKETGRKFIDVYNELAAQGLSLTEITVKLNIRLVSTVSTYLFKHELNEQRKLNPIDESNYVIQGLKGRNPNTVEQMFKTHLNVEYKDWLEQKYIIEGLSQQQIRNLTGLSVDAISGAVKRYGLIKSNSQARQEAMKRGSINYDKILSKSRKTMNKSKSSNTQETFMNLIKYNLELAFAELTNIEIVIGYNEYCVLGSMEIDIPIIIIKDDQLYKIALEYDGDIWHDDNKKDKPKEIQLKEKNWFLIRIEESSSDSGNLGLVEDKAKKVIKQILEHIHN